MLGKKQQTKPSFDKTPFDAHVTAQTQNEDTDVFQKLFLPNICWLIISVLIETARRFSLLLRLVFTQQTSRNSYCEFQSILNMYLH